MTPLPTRNSQLPLRRAAFRSVPEMLDYAAQGETGITFYSARGEILSGLSWRTVRERAQATARRLIGAGFSAGERILLTADTWPGFVDVFFGCPYAGLIPVPVSIPVAAVGIDDLTGFLAEAAREFPAVRLQGGLAAIEALPDLAVALRPLGPSDLCYIQFSSGSTRHPHGVQITQAALMANLAGMTGPAGLDVVPGDRVVSWLPLYHDMGLIGFTMAPLSSQLSIDYLTPRDFARRPMQWLNLMSRNGGTIAYSPSFGYDLATRRAASQLPDDLDLSRWRVAGIGGDMIRPDVLERFAEAFAGRGFDARAFLPSYGMAEVCLAITFAEHRTGVRTDMVGARRFVICGKVLPGHRLEVRGEAGSGDGAVLGERAVGRIFVQGPSIMPGYYNEPEATREVLSADGWLDTGDLGYLLDGEIVVTGRAKDLIIVNGRNIWPQDIEWAIEARRIVKNGDSVAFSVDAGEEGKGGERVVVAVLARVSGDEARTALGSNVAGAVRESISVDCEVVLVPPALGLPTTSSGKLSRSRAKANYLAGLYAPKTAAA